MQGSLTTTAVSTVRLPVHSAVSQLPIIITHSLAAGCDLNIAHLQHKKMAQVQCIIIVINNACCARRRLLILLNGLIVKCGSASVIRCGLIAVVIDITQVHVIHVLYTMNV